MKQLIAGGAPATAPPNRPWPHRFEHRSSKSHSHRAGSGRFGPSPFGSGSPVVGPRFGKSAIKASAGVSGASSESASTGASSESAFQVLVRLSVRIATCTRRWPVGSRASGTYDSPWPEGPITLRIGSPPDGGDPTRVTFGRVLYRVGRLCPVARSESHVSGLRVGGPQARERDGTSHHSPIISVGRVLGSPPAACNPWL